MLPQLIHLVGKQTDAGPGGADGAFNVGQYHSLKVFSNEMGLVVIQAAHFFFCLGMGVMVVDFTNA